MKILSKNLDTYQALIFDLDGTLLNSMPLHNRAWKDAFAENGVTVTESFLMETAGMASPRIVSIINERFNKALDPKAVSLLKREKYLETLEQVEVFKPLLAIIQTYHHKLPLGVITGGSHAVVDMLLPKLNLAHYFDFIICSDDTKLGKDSAEPYELMASTLKVNISKCLFFDDGDIGLKGARLAGMDVLHVDINHPDVFSIPL
jgi:HAD superfamily hydrolase (TIGR01509 family)